MNDPDHSQGIWNGNSTLLILAQQMEAIQHLLRVKCLLEAAGAADLEGTVRALGICPEPERTAHVHTCPQHLARGGRAVREKQELKVPG